MSLSAYGNEILSRGAKAVLPHHLPADWLEKIQLMADIFLDTNYFADRCKTRHDSPPDPILEASVSEVLRFMGRDPVDMDGREMTDLLAAYAVSVTMETVRRQTGLEMTLPTVDNLLSLDRIRGYRELYPELIELLDKVCITRKNRKR